MEGRRHAGAPVLVGMSNLSSMAFRPHLSRSDLKNPAHPVSESLDPRKMGHVPLLGRSGPWTGRSEAGNPCFIACTTRAVGNPEPARLAAGMAGWKSVSGAGWNQAIVQKINTQHQAVWENARAVR